MRRENVIAQRRRDAEGSKRIPKKSVTLRLWRIDKSHQLSHSIARNVASPFTISKPSVREPFGSEHTDWHCPGEPEPEIYFFAEEQRETCLTTGRKTFAPLPPRSRHAGLLFALARLYQLV